MSLNMSMSERLKQAKKNKGTASNRSTTINDMDMILTFINNQNHIKKSEKKKFNFEGQIVGYEKFNFQSSENVRLL